LAEKWIQSELIFSAVNLPSSDPFTLFTFLPDDRIKPWSLRILAKLGRKPAASFENRTITLRRFSVVLAAILACDEHAVAVKGRIELVVVGRA